MRVFVTGGSGFIGRVVVDLLVKSGNSVCLLIPENESGSVIHKEHKTIYADMTCLESYRSEVESWRPDCALHLAWNVNPREYLNSRSNIKDLSASLALIDFLYGIGCKHIVAVGSSAEYKNSSEILTEDMALSANDTLYAAAKISLSAMGKELARNADCTFAWARIFNLYGPHENCSRLIPAAITKLLNGETFEINSAENVRDYLHVHDVASALVQLLNVKATEAYNICSSVPVTVKELLTVIHRLVGKGVVESRAGIKPNRWNPLSVVGSNKKLLGTGWKQTISIEDGLASTIKWWQNQSR